MCHTITNIVNLSRSSVPSYILKESVLLLPSNLQSLSRIENDRTCCQMSTDNSRLNPPMLQTLFVLVSFFWLRVLDKAEYSAFESTLNSSIVSYRIILLIRPYCIHS